MEKTCTIITVPRFHVLENSPREINGTGLPESKWFLIGKKEILRTGRRRERGMPSASLKAKKFLFVAHTQCVRRVDGVNAEIVRKKIIVLSQFWQELKWFNKTHFFKHNAEDWNYDSQRIVLNPAQGVPVFEHLFEHLFSDIFSNTSFRPSFRTPLFERFRIPIFEFDLRL